MHLLRRADSNVKQIVNLSMNSFFGIYKRNWLCYSAIGVWKTPVYSRCGAVHKWQELGQRYSILYLAPSTQVGRNCHLVDAAVTYNCTFQKWTRSLEIRWKSELPLNSRIPVCFKSTCRWLDFITECLPERNRVLKFEHYSKRSMHGDLMYSNSMSWLVNPECN